VIIFRKNNAPFAPPLKSLSLSSSQSAPSAWADINTTSTVVQQPARGTINTKHIRTGKDRAFSPKRTTSNYARPGRDPTDASSITTPSTTAPVVDPHPTEPTNALARRICFPTTPYKPDAWETALQAANLLRRFSHIPLGFRNGFIINFPRISRVQIPPNKDSVALHHIEFAKTLDKEIVKNRYLGPFTASLLTILIGPFQTSPISIVPKPGCPEKFKLIQNFSYPISPSPNSLTHQLIPSSMPTTFNIMGNFFHSLPINLSSPSKLQTCNLRCCGSLPHNPPTRIPMAISRRPHRQ
jgi:hypothetical protein